MDTVKDVSPYVTGLIGFAGGALVANPVLAFYLFEGCSHQQQ
jgi:hypothetical protein